MDKITKLDFSNAFKTLDEIEIPEVREEAADERDIELNESLASWRKRRVMDCLVEDYYDLNSEDDMQQLAQDRAEDVAQAKLDKIEKIVDLDAETPDDLQPSYVGKIIVQCPKCMQLFYKDESEIVKDENDQTICNVGEKCANCNNQDGFDIIGKVAAEEPEAPAEEPAPVEEAPVEEAPAEEPAPAPAEEAPAEEPAAEEPAGDDLDLNLDLGEPEETQESFAAHSGDTLNESVNESMSDVDRMLDSLKYQLDDVAPSAGVEESLTEDRDEVDVRLDDLLDKTLDLTEGAEELKESGLSSEIEAKLDALKYQLDDVAPGAGVEESLEEAAPAPFSVEAMLDDLINEPMFGESLHKSEANAEVDKKHCSDNDTENMTINEDIDLTRVIPTMIDGWAKEDVKNGSPAMSREEFGIECDGCGVACDDKDYEKYINWYNEYSNEDEMNAIEDIDEEKFDECVTEALKESYGNVESFSMTDASMVNNKFLIEGKISFKSGTSKDVSIKVGKAECGTLHGICEDLDEKNIYVSGSYVGSKFIAESARLNEDNVFQKIGNGIKNGAKAVGRAFGDLKDDKEVLDKYNGTYMLTTWKDGKWAPVATSTELTTYDAAEKAAKKMSEHSAHVCINGSKSKAIRVFKNGASVKKFDKFMDKVSKAQSELITAKPQEKAPSAQDVSDPGSQAKQNPEQANEVGTAGDAAAKEASATQQSNEDANAAEAPVAEQPAEQPAETPAAEQPSEAPAAEPQKRESQDYGTRLNRQVAFQKKLRDQLLKAGIAEAEVDKIFPVKADKDGINRNRIYATDAGKALRKAFLGESLEEDIDESDVNQMMDQLDGFSEEEIATRATERASDEQKKLAAQGQARAAQASQSEADHKSKVDAMLDELSMN